MPVYQRMIQTLQSEVGAVPVDMAGDPVETDWFNMAHASRMLFLISQGVWEGGETPAVTLWQAIAADGSDPSPGEDHPAKSVSFTEYWDKLALVDPPDTDGDGKWHRHAVTGDTFNLTDVANTLTAIEIQTGQLDRDHGYNYVQLSIAEAAGVSMVAVMAIFDGLRDQGVPQMILDDPKL